MTCFKLTKEGKGDRMDMVMSLRLHFYVTYFMFYKMVESILLESLLCWL